MKTSFLVLVLLIGFSCKKVPESLAVSTDKNKNHIPSLMQDTYQELDKLFKQNPVYIAYDFDYPVGKPNGEGYYNAQKFRKNNHLGDDRNGKGRGNTDLGDPFYAIASGYVCFAEDIGGGWGNVIRIVHKHKKITIMSLCMHMLMPYR